MLPFTGCTRKKKFVKMLESKLVGRVMQPNSLFTPYTSERWIADNGAYSHWMAGKSFNGDIYKRYLDKIAQHGKPFFAVLPDIVAGGLFSLEFSHSWLDKVPEEWKWYLVLQDGISTGDIIRYLKEERTRISGLFLGGTLQYKSLAKTWKELSSDNNLPIHYGRCARQHRMHYAWQIGFDSCDSTWPVYQDDRMPEFLSWIDDAGQYDPRSYKQIQMEEILNDSSK